MAIIYEVKLSRIDGQKREEVTIQQPWFEDNRDQLAFAIWMAILRFHPDTNRQTCQDIGAYVGMVPRHQPAAVSES